jgi:HAE1 family hydrophobic/amphiphilic exporter-1
MTSLAFILGVVPLALAAGAGAEMRQSLGTAVFAGMVGVTLFGLVFTPVFYVLARRISLLFGVAGRAGTRASKDAAGRVPAVEGEGGDGRNPRA